VKRLIDTLIVLIAAPVWVPVAAIVALAIRVTMGAPVMFVSERAGLGGKAFRFLKFRTMREGKVKVRGEGEGDGERLTKLGRFLRATSLDELPQLLHVLSGKMALVGPRPLPVAYLPRYSAEQMRRHEVRPGITGWAQVNGRNELDWEEKFRLDVWYVDHRSLWLDAKILFLTALKTVRGSGISHAGFDTMYEFKGEEKVKGEGQVQERTDSHSTVELGLES